MYQGQSYHQTSSITAQKLTAPKPIPSILYWLVALAIGSSFYVAIEPAPTDLLFLVLFIAMLGKSGIRFPLDLNPVLSIGLLSFIAGSALSLLTSALAGSAIFYLAITLYMLVLWYLIVTLLANYGLPMWHLIQRTLVIAAVIGALIGFISHFSTALQDYLGVQSSYGDRARGAFKDPNVYGPFLCAALLLVINRMVVRGVLSILSVSLLCLFALEILAALSRGAYVNISVTLFVYFALIFFVVSRSRWISRSLVIMAVGSVLVLAASVVFLRASGLEDLFAHRLGLQNYDDKRFSTQSLALESLTNTPFGVGPGQSQDILQMSPHSLYIRIAIENGLVSLIAFLLFLTATLWIALSGAWRRGPFQDIYVCCTAITLGILVNSLVIDSLHWRHFFLFLAIPIGLNRYERWTARQRSTARAPLSALKEHPYPKAPAGSGSRSLSFSELPRSGDAVAPGRGPTASGSTAVPLRFRPAQERSSRR
jgi:O-antigen ligase